MLLPFGLMKQTGWLTVVWTLFIADGVYYVVRWTDELSNPFGHDLCGVPLEDFIARVKEITKNNLMVLRDGAWCGESNQR